MKKLITVALLTSLLSAPALASELTGKLKAISQSKTLLLGYQSQSIPFSFSNQDGQALGYSVDLCKRVAASIKQQLNLAELEIKWIPLTLENRFDMVARGKVDMECGTSSNTISRQKLVDFSLMTWVDGGNFITKGDRPANSLADMADKRVGVVIGNTTEQALREWMKNNMISFSVVPVPSHRDGLQQLQDGQLDAYAADQTILIGLVSTTAEQMQMRLASNNFSYEPYALTVPRNDADFKQAVNSALAQLYRSGEVFIVYNTWFGKFGKPPAALMAMYGMNALPE